MRYKLKLPLARIVRFCGKIKPSYSESEVLYLAISYFYWKRLFADTTYTSINLKDDPLADLVFVDYFEFHSFKDLWRLIYPLLEPISDHAGFETQKIRLKSKKPTTVVGGSCKKSRNKSLVKYKRRRLEDGLFDKSLNEIQSDYSLSSDDSSCTLVAESASTSNHNLFYNQQAHTSRQLLVEPDKPFWHYIKPRLIETSFKNDEDEISDTETVVFDDVAISSVSDLQTDQSSDENVETIINLDELNFIKNRISLVLANSRMLDDEEPVENNQMFINEEIDYDSDLEVSSQILIELFNVQRQNFTN